MRRHTIFVLSTAIIGIAGLGGSAFIHAPWIVWNATPSAPLGLYRLDSISVPQRGDLVLAEPPSWIRKLAAERGYLPDHIPLIKRVAGDKGDTVCSNDDFIAVNERTVARRLQKDSQGRPMPYWTGCRTLGESEIFLLMAHIPVSFDGRYFGPIPRHAVIGKLMPLWTW